MIDLSKSQKKHLRPLADKCYEAEMADALTGLYENFKQWERGEITVWQLNEKIHEYHDGTDRSLYKFFKQLNDPAVAVARSVARGIMKIEDVREDCRALLAPYIEFYQGDVD